MSRGGGHARGTSVPGPETTYEGIRRSLWEHEGETASGRRGGKRENRKGGGKSSEKAHTPAEKPGRGTQLGKLSGS